jgi:hypothetical protein
MVSLRVRSEETKNPQPKFLYQQLPHEAITLFASIPSAPAAVSISQLKGKYPISTVFPAKVIKGYVVVYQRRTNGRYEARKVFDGDTWYDAGRFCEIARRQVHESMGRVVRIPEKHFYFAPTRTQWGVILRDGGFTFATPSSDADEISPEILQLRHGTPSCGLVARVPVWASMRSCGTRLLSVFSQVELTMDPNPTPERGWIKFREFQRIRAARSRPPKPLAALFQQWLQRLAAASGFASWSFRKGVLFGDRMEWWGTKSRRLTMHEGIDFAEGSLMDGAIQAIREGTPVSALADGKVVGILDDFLSQTLVVCHTGIKDSEGNWFYTLYSHIHPERDKTGSVKGGQIIGQVCKSRRAGAPAHLHLTGAWIPESISGSQITLDMINPAFAPIVLTNFNSLLLGRRRLPTGSRQ